MSRGRLAAVAGGGALAIYLGDLLETGFHDAYAVAGLVCLVPTIPLLALVAWRFPAPWPVVAAAGLWGALGAGYAAGTVNGWATDFAFANLQPGPQIDVLSAAVAAVGEEMLKGAGVLALLLVAARRAPPERLLLAGLLLGAAAGVGFNYSEAVQYTGDQYASGGLAAAAGEMFSRQVIGALAGHPSYTALAGAGFALGLRRGGVAGVGLAAAGLAAAVAAHFAWDAWGVGIPSPDGMLGALVQALTGLAFDGVSLAFAGVLLWLSLGPRSAGRPIR